MYTVNEKEKYKLNKDSVKCTFCKENCPMRDEEFLPTLKQQVTGQFCTKV